MLDFILKKLRLFGFGFNRYLFLQLTGKIVYKIAQDTS